MSRFAALALLLGACASLASKADYRAYRQVALAEDERARMLATRDYVEAHPDGEWYPELRAERDAAERPLFEGAGDADGLRFYLEAYPNGRYAPQARTRLSALSSVAASRSTEDATRRGVLADRAAAAAEERRLWGTRAVTYWSRVLLSIDGWGSPISEVAAGDEDFDQAFGSPPRPRCSSSECIKFYQLDYAIPVPGRSRLDRTIRLLLRLRLTDGKLTRAELLMPSFGFSRWYELENREPVYDEDTVQRTEVTEWALQRIVPIIRSLVPDAATIDVVPEPVDPPTVRAPNQPDEGAGAIPGGAEDDVALDESVTGSGDDGVDLSAGSMVLPIPLQGLRAGDVQVVVFAASPDDEGPAYDGMIIELVPAADAS
ncbi:MAG: hypothetical protein AAGH15_12285 [Myxococcota bacterium]